MAATSVTDIFRLDADNSDRQAINLPGFAQLLQGREQNVDPFIGDQPANKNKIAISRDAGVQKDLVVERIPRHLGGNTKLASDRVAD